ncbi:Holliday junction resolvase Hjc [Methanothermococcus okinawensis]|uniref:Crossover junction endodeoxyribonuclease Hjc n=1 Tax=Methanothermococcus okinawensis (strain DSM 14208 / JCM 11175 / IH1) TaxID=647113 RepID=F8AJM5_METOI|nr:Holliday junction resolvase Hjc [Methanothermococcus okinawensis]AEH07213.1 Resolvase, Holliday junction-type [Methanothermococcus okinawensis IH1]
MKGYKYKKGSNFERELKKMFENKGFAVVRSAGSHGIDLIVGKKGNIYALECKITSKEKFYISKEDVDKLINFSEIFGAQPYIALKMNGKILFINPYLLTTSKKNYLLDYYKICPIAKDFKELIGEGKQMKFTI